MDDTIRVALVTPDLRVGGAERLLVDMVAAWQRKRERISPYVYAFRGGPIKLELERLGCQVSLPLSAISQSVNPLIIGWLIHSFRRHGIHLVHLNLPRAGFYGRLAARALRLAVLYTEHSVWEVYEPLSRLLNKVTYSLNTHVVAVSDAVVASIKQNSKYPTMRLSRIYNGIRPTNDDTDRRQRCEIRQLLGVPEDAIVVGNIANLHPRKGHKFLLHALQNLAGEFPKLYCAIIGRDDGEGHALRNLATKLGVQQHVLWLGFRPDARQLLAAFDIFVLPSLFEGLPVALIEAMDAGLPIVATRVGGNSELVIHGETGFLVEPGNVEQLVGTLSELVMDPAKRFQMGAAGRIRMREEFTVDQMATKYADLYKTLLHQQSGVTGS